MKFFKKLIILFFIVFAFQNVFACKFIPREYVDIYNDSKNVILAEFVELGEDKISFKNLKTFKGSVSENIELQKNKTSCGYSNNVFTQGDKFWILFLPENLKWGSLSMVSRHKNFKTRKEAEVFFNQEILKKQIPEKIKTQKPPTTINMTPPNSPPPTKEEVDELIANAQKQLYEKNHKSWWQKIVDFVRSLF